MSLASPLPLPLLLLSLAVVFAAGTVRGFAGFGFSALCVAALSLLVSPAKVVPPVFMLEILASVTLLRGALRAADWRWLGWLALGNALFIPLGVMALAYLPELPLRLLIGAVLLWAALSLRARRRAALAPTPAARLFTGVVSGFCNGVAAIGGMAVAVLLSAAQVAPATLRGTMIVLFLFTDLYALAWAGVLSAGADQGSALVDAGTLAWVVWLAPAMLAGIWVGQRAFATVSPEQFRHHVLNLLALIALLSLGRALLALTD